MCPHAAVYRPWPAASPVVVARSLMRWSRPSTAQVIVVDREVVLHRIRPTVGMAAGSNIAGPGACGEACSERGLPRTVCRCPVLRCVQRLTRGAW